VIVIPAIDLRGGACVRLRQGRADEQTTFSDDPVAVARRWAELGAARLHVVDLDGAFAGAPRQTALIAAIARAVAPVPVEAGGGLRDADAVDRVLGAGARWAVLGTRAVLDPSFLQDVCAAHAGQVIVAVDARGERVAVKGWTETTDETALDLGRRAAALGAAALLYTDVARDGMETGPNVDTTRALAERLSLPVLASGGVGSLDHLRDLATIPGLSGVIVGRALYTGAIDLPSAMSALASVAR
jgi:phosphoribosylformimino-5-aminoimidazole carboxamide ribotide isomerase